MEWAIPIDTWSTSSISFQLNRQAHTDRGDYMRIVASEDDTEWEMVSYNSLTGLEIDRSSGVLDAGKFFQQISDEKMRKEPYYYRPEEIEFKPSQKG